MGDYSILEIDRIEDATTAVSAPFASGHYSSVKASPVDLLTALQETLVRIVLLLDR